MCYASSTHDSRLSENLGAILELCTPTYVVILVAKPEGSVTGREASLVYLGSLI